MFPIATQNFFYYLVSSSNTLTFYLQKSFPFAFYFYFFPSILLFFAHVLTAIPYVIF